MDEATRQFVRRRAGNRCEYCQIPQAATPFIAFHVEHIRARQHGGDDNRHNLALACDRCNAFKGPNLATIDPETDETVPLFDPRKDEWLQHFLVEGGEILGLTTTGRATVQLLRMNARRRVQLRDEWPATEGSWDDPEVAGD